MQSLLIPKCGREGCSKSVLVFVLLLCWGGYICRGFWIGNVVDLVMRLNFHHSICSDWNQYYNLSCTGSIWAIKLHSLDKFLLFTVTDQDIVFMVSDSCWAMVRNGDSISVDVTRDNKKRLEQWLFLFFLDNLAVV